MTLKTRWFVIVALMMAGCGGGANDASQLGNDPRSSEAQRGTGTLHTFCSGAAIEVWAGVGNANAGTLVGTITFSGGTATLTLADGSPFVPTVLHLQFATALSGIPVNASGNPVPGHFEYQFPISSPPYVFDFTPPTDTVFVAAHFVFTEPGGVGGFDLLLPAGLVDVSVTAPFPGGPAYFPHTYLTNAGSLSGDYLGWCADVGRDIYPDTTYPAKLYSTYDAAAMTALAGLFDPTAFLTANLPQVNYVLNHFQVGTMVMPVTNATACTPTGDAAQALTYSDLQKAFWWFISNNTTQTGGLDVWSQNRVDAIICAANASGAAFTPVCGQKIGFFAVPLAGDPLAIDAQPILISAPVPCGGGDETAWADGKTGALFPRESQWGTYFKWNATCSAQ